MLEGPTIGLSSWTNRYGEAVTFADSVLHLVRVGARIDPWVGPKHADPSQRAAFGGEVSAGESAAPMAPTTLSAVESADPEVLDGLDAGTAGATPDLAALEPGLADLEAAVALVSAGLATRVVLSGFTSWPGLLWRAYQLAEDADVLILPTVVRPGGKVDIAVTRDTASNG